VLAANASFFLFGRRSTAFQIRSRRCRSGTMSPEGSGPGACRISGRGRLRRAEPTSRRCVLGSGCGVLQLSVFVAIFMKPLEGEAAQGRSVGQSSAAAGTCEQIWAGTARKVVGDRGRERERKQVNRQTDAPMHAVGLPPSHSVSRE